MKQFDVIEATFSPQVVSDLKPAAIEFAGRRCQWQAAWVIEDGRYAGQWAMVPMIHQSPGFAWAPFTDLCRIA